MGPKIGSGKKCENFVPVKNNRNIMMVRYYYRE